MKNGLKSTYTACVVIPIHKRNLSLNEKLSLKIVSIKLSEYKRYLVVPNGLDTSEYQKVDPQIEIVAFEPHFFKNERSYNLLCRKPIFYYSFKKFDYMLIYQLDCFIFSNALHEWLNLNIDYIGPAWVEMNWAKKRIKIKKIIERSNRVGNGGFSIRRISKFYSMSKIMQFFSTYAIFHEDVLWSNIAPIFYRKMKIAKFTDALRFGFEENPKLCFKLNNHKLPFGCHAWEKHDKKFWIPLINESFSNRKIY